MPTLARSFAAAAVLSVLALGTLARGEIITSNVVDPRDGLSFVDNTYLQRAQAFMTTSTGTTLSTVKLDLLNFGATSETFAVNLYSVSEGIPDAVVATLFSGTAGSIPTSPQLFTISGLNLDLSPSTEYYVVCQRGSAGFSGGWAYNTETTGSGDGFLPDNSYSLTTINNWQGLSTSQPYRMEIVAVPEPPAIVLSGIGLATALYAMRRRGG